MSNPLSIFEPGLPKYLSVARHYEEAILSGKYRVGEQLPSERQLATEWSITAMTVRQALEVLRGKRLIVRRQGHGTFVSGQPAAPEEAAPRSGAVYVLGLTPSQSASPRQVNWQPRLRRFQGLVEGAFRHGLVLKSNVALDPEASPSHLVAMLGEAAGLILHEELLPEVVLAGLAELNVPMVAINCYARVDYCSRLLIDSRRGALSVVRYLAGLGHKRIGLIVGDPERYSMGLRLSGYRDAHALLNLPLREEYTIVEPSGLEEHAVEACRRLLALPEPPTAIFAASDRRAIGILDAADELGISIPEELSVVGVDDLAEAACSDPPLTTLHNPLFASGEEAIELLLRQMRGEVQAGTVTMLSTRLIERGSTAAPR